MGQRHSDGFPSSSACISSARRMAIWSTKAFWPLTPLDPRPEIMPRLLEAMPREGPVLAYNAPFELARLGECCLVLPEFRRWKSNVGPRVIDLPLPFRGFAVLSSPSAIIGRD